MTAGATAVDPPLAAPAVRGHRLSRPTAVAALVLPAVVGLLAAAGHLALDSPTPHVERARLAYRCAAAVALAGLFGAVILARRLRLGNAGWGVLLFVPVAILLAVTFTSYADEAVPARALLLVFWLVSTTTVGIWTLDRREGSVGQSPLPLLGHLVAWCLAFLVVLVGLLLDLPHQAEQARAAHTPLGLLVPLAAIAVAAWGARRAHAST